MTEQQDTKSSASVVIRLTTETDTMISAARLSFALLAALLMTLSPAAFAQQGPAAVQRNISVDFSDTKGPMAPKTGIMLVPNYNLPDGRIIPLKVPRLRDDYDNQNILNYTPNNQVDVWPYEDSRMARVRTACERLNSLNIAYDPIFCYTQSWLSTNRGMSAPVSLDLYKQWCKDNVQFAKDNNLGIAKFGVWNENWGIKREEFLQMYKYAWHGVKEVMPDAMINAPSYGGYGSDTPAFLQFVCEEGLTVEAFGWHEFGDEKDMETNIEHARALISDQFTQLGIREIYIEEYEPNTGNRGSLVNWLACLEDLNVDMALKSHWNGGSSCQGFGELVTVDSRKANSCARIDQWWAMKAYAEMTGTRVGVVQPPDAATAKTRAIAAKDTSAGEAKILVGNNNTNAVELTLNLNNQPFRGQPVRIDKYRVTTNENDGLTLQSTETPASANNLATSISLATNDAWLIVIKKNESAPGSFCLKAPDDDDAVTPTPAFTWQPASGASGYSIEVSTNRDLSRPVISQDGITGTSWTVGAALAVGTRYYWSVAAVNAHGSTPAAMHYSFLVCSNAYVPGRLAMYLVPKYATGVGVRPRFAWSPAHRATSYTLQIDDDEDFSSPVVNAPNLAKSENKGNMGGPHYCYTLTNDLAFDTTYYSRVVAVNSSGSRIMTEPAHVFTTRPRGDNPGAFALLAPAGGAARLPRRGNLKWAPSNGAFFYKLEVSTAADFSNVALARDYITANSYTLGPDELDANATYYWRVTALIKDRKYSTPASNNGLAFTMENKPCPPLLKAVEVGNGSGKATVHFSAVKDATGYTVKYGTSPGEYSKSVTGVSGSPKATTGLTNNRQYWFAVVAVNAKGESSVFNEISATPVVSEAKPVSVARDKPATASSVSEKGLEADKAFDGSIATRWSSAYNDNEWIYVDLGAVMNLTGAKLRWEAAYGKAYKIQVSDNATAWTDIYSTTTGDGGVDRISFTARGRYIRLLGQQRSTIYGYSLWTFEVYGDTAE